MGESIGKQLCEQSQSYAYKWDFTTHCVIMKRRNQKGLYCMDCNNETAEYCSTCDERSPIPKWVRLREITFTTVDDNWYMVNCSCLHNDGHPCRYLACLIQLQIGHFIPRYHRKYAAFFGTDRRITEFYEAANRDHRILISTEEFQHIKKQVREVDNSDLPVDFWNQEKSVCYQSDKTGLHVVQVQDDTDEIPLSSLFEESGLSQDFGCPEPDEHTTPAIVRGRHVHPPQTGHFFNDNVARLQIFADLASKDAN
ncbi:hypothetical protein SEMRO_185_G080460.1 [Seminavis robusta]|uniref:SWIM-type domain-containing protein n=1 Tax=Seminavis robusta TaxID=568900 RepID=A0A9N8H6Y7_9STRA|nr:hypothetical protein SEMRO_185_G080460.1 [Seminavis robusta]|eukprot:Sro185_g080460.1 n/a (254) ;mRNA; f:79049-79810